MFVVGYYMYKKNPPNQININNHDHRYLFGLEGSICTYNNLGSMLIFLEVLTPTLFFHHQPPEFSSLASEGGVGVISSNPSSKQS